ncbi:MAG TPA: CPBP family intramembrane glutamic endopeptidase [Terriglobales bacterium]
MNNHVDEPIPPADASLLPVEPPAIIEPSPLHKVFIGKDGLRAGWSLLIFIAFVAAISFFVRHFHRQLHMPDESAVNGKSGFPPSFGLIAEGLNFGIIAILTWIMSKIERRPVAVYGLGDSRKLRRFFAGFVWGVTCLSLLILTLWQSGLMAFDGRILFGADILRYGAVWLLVFLLVGLAEEYTTRGFVQYTLTRGLAAIYRSIFKTRHSQALGFWTSALIFSILFGLGHSSNPGESPIGLLSAGTAGLVFCFSLWRTGSLWWAIGFHTSWDWGQSFLYGVPDSGLITQHHLLATHPIGKPILSGGTTGPEGSIFIVAILAIVAVIILLTLPRRQAILPV